MPKPTGVTFDPITYALLLPINKHDHMLLHDYAPDAYQAGMIVKPEFHVTILGTSSGNAVKQALQKCSQTTIDNATGTFLRWTTEINWEFEFTNIIHRLRKTYDDGETRESIIHLIKMPGLIEFFNKLNRMLWSLDAPCPMPHITLYAKSTNPNTMTQGIGIHGKADLEMYSEEII